uniref:Formylglycine-generating enzyme, required for sulfatase activity, contains SUMF1/FGE domain n=1 Tax=Candidatus Kentrum sp. LFY TaxID=2126342 RepID=A0A450W6P5_9GAMM|nr:MAG: Formylglycine-generating enzyme, required for sulfatase activity, contains SUMF1/FGE domain [Candidatus Kentron sp. LFY]
MTPCPESLHQHPLSPWLAWLPVLENLLAARGLPVSPDRWLNLHDLLFRFYREGRLPEEITGLRPYLRPLFCRNPEESAAFDGCFDDWVNGGRDAGLSADKPSISPYAEPIEPLGTNLGRPSPPPVLRWPFAAFIALVLLLSSLAGVFFMEPGLAPPTPAPPVSRPAAPETPPPSPDSPSREYLELSLDPLPPRALPDKLHLSPQNAARLDAWGKRLPWLVVPVALVWLLWAWLRRRYVLRRAAGSEHDPLASLSIPAGSRALFDSPSLRDALRRLHQPIEIEGRYLYVSATLAASIRQAGFFRPVFRGRRFVPELLVLIDTKDPRDLLAGMGRLAATRLRQHGHEVFVYYYRGAPGGFIDERFQAAGGVEELFSRHPHARLLLIGDPGALLTNLGTHLIDEAASLTRWSQRGVLSTRDSHPARIGVLTARGFYTEPLTDEGIRAISVQFAESSQTMVSPRRLASPPAPFAGRHLLPWWRRPPRKEFQADLAALRRYLGEDGYFLLGAMAVYPALHWGLTQVLDCQLFPDDSPDENNPRRREQRLLEVAQLAWSRIGWLPEWFRIHLLRHLTRRERTIIRREFRMLLEPRAEEADGQAIRLPFRTHEPGSWRDSLKARIHRTPGINDAVFANLIMGGRLGPWDFTLPRWIGDRLPGISSGGWLIFLGPLLEASVGALLCWFAISGIWQSQRPWFEDRALEMQIAANREHSFAIIHGENAESLAQVFRTSLTRYGFTSVELGSEFGKTLPPLPPGHMVLVDPGASDANRWAARAMATHLAWLDYQSPDAIGIQSDANPGPENAVPENTILVRLSGDSVADPIISLQDLRPGERPSTTLDGEQKTLFGDPDKLIAAMDRLDRPSKGRPSSDRRSPGRPPPAFTRFRDTLKGGSQGPEMIALPAGEFLMGSPEDESMRDFDEGPRYRVRIGNPFALGVTEVTFADYDRFARATGRKLPDDEGWGRDRRPVIDVSWNNATAYAQWLSGETGEKYRLPTEAEWEYAARAGTETPFSTGECITTDQANYDGNYGYADCGARTGVYRRKTVPVGSLPANPWGIHEMHGNVWEWTWDCWHGDYQGASVDGSAWGEEGDGDCSRRVVRGGGCFDGPRFLRSADRDWDRLDGAYNFTGFRLAREF